MEINVLQRSYIVQKLFPCKRKRYEKGFSQIITTGITFENGLLVEEIPNLEELNIITRNLFDIDEKTLVLLCVYC